MPQGVLSNEKCKKTIEGSHAALIKSKITLDDKDSTEVDEFTQCISLSNKTQELTGQTNSNLEIHYNQKGQFEEAGVSLTYSKGDICNQNLENEESGTNPS